MREIELAGLDGGNLLGYLAALGTLRVLTVAEPEAEVRMSWVDKGWWRPVVHHSRIGTGEELVAAIEEGVCGESSINAAWEIGNDLTLTRSEFGGHMRARASDATAGQREAADFLAAFGSDVFGTGPKKEQMSDTEFRTMSGSGHQHFLGFMKELARGTDKEHVKRALLEPWDYADDRPSLRWDPADYRPHALRAEDPSGDPIKTMRGANRLAVEALPLFPTVPEGRQVRTVGFCDRDGKTEIAWPIWVEPLNLSTVASLLASEGVQEGDQSTLTHRGIVQVFRARRFTRDKKRSFSPARAVL